VTLFQESDDAAWVINENDFYAIKNELPDELFIAYTRKDGYTMFKKAALQVRVVELSLTTDKGDDSDES
jgi:hypothetical protein